jgi:hypothetical protein
MDRKTLAEELEFHNYDHFKENKEAVREALYWLVEAFGEDCSRIRVQMKSRTAVEFKDFALRHANSLQDREV